MNMGNEQPELSKWLKNNPPDHFDYGHFIQRSDDVIVPSSHFGRHGDNDYSRFIHGSWQVLPDMESSSDPSTKKIELTRGV